MADSLLLTEARTAQGDKLDVRLAAGRIAELAARLAPQAGEEVVDLAGRLLLPAPAEPHAHLDKAFSAAEVPNPTGDLPGAVDAWREHRRTLRPDVLAERSRAAAHAGLARGATAIRSHVDVHPDIGLAAVDALLALRAELSDALDLQLCAMAYPLAGPAGAVNRRLVAAALDRGVDLVGGAPHIGEEPDAETEACLELARAAGRGVDLHTDEHLRATCDLRVLARQAHGFPHPVTASHCVSLGGLPEQVQREVAGETAAAGVAVICCPQTNLYLQGRERQVGMPRALTALRVLEQAGVLVAAGGDNTQDPFNPIGRGDPLETAALLVAAGHLAPEPAYDYVSNRARAAMGLEPVALRPGAPAELLAIAAGSVREAIATCTEDRIVIHRGRIVATTRVRRQLAVRPPGRPREEP